MRTGKNDIMIEGRLMVKRPVVLEVPLVLDSFYPISFLQF